MRAEMIEIVVKTDPSIEDEEIVRRGLIASNTEAWGRPGGYLPFVFHLTDPATGETGGATGYGLFDWVFLELLFVPEHKH